MRRPSSSSLRTLAALLALLPLITGCEQIADLLELPNPSRDAARPGVRGPRHWRSLPARRTLARGLLHAQRQRRKSGRVRRLARHERLHDGAQARGRALGSRPTLRRPPSTPLHRLELREDLSICARHRQGDALTPSCWQRRRAALASSVYRLIIAALAVIADPTSSWLACVTAVPIPFCAFLRPPHEPAHPPPACNAPALSAIAAPASRKG